jgi:hypothetical protein
VRLNASSKQLESPNKAILPLESSWEVAGTLGYIPAIATGFFSALLPRISSV